MITQRPIPRRRPQHPGGWTPPAKRQAAREAYADALATLVHAGPEREQIEAARAIYLQASAAYYQGRPQAHESPAEKRRLTAALIARRPHEEQPA